MHRLHHEPRKLRRAGYGTRGRRGRGWAKVNGTASASSRTHSAKLPSVHVRSNPLRIRSVDVALECGRPESDRVHSGDCPGRVRTELTAVAREFAPIPLSVSEHSSAR